MPLTILVLFMITVIVQLISFVLILIRMFRREGVIKGILGFVIGIYAFVWGWIKHKELQLTKIMLVWSISMAAQIVIMVTGLPVLMVWLQSGIEPGIGAITADRLKQQPDVTSISLKTPPPTQPASGQKVARPLFSEQEMTEKMNNLNRVIDQNKENADAFYSRGWLHAYDGQFQNALKDYSEAIRIHDQYADAYFNRGMVNVKLNRLSQAVSDFSRVVEITPGAVDGYCNRGNAYLKMGQVDQAIGDYTEALKRAPEDADIYYNRAMAYMEKEDRQKAEEDLRAASRLGLEEAKKILETMVKASETPIPSLAAPGHQGAIQKDIENREDIGKTVEKSPAPAAGAPGKTVQPKVESRIQKKIVEPHFSGSQKSSSPDQAAGKAIVKESIRMPEDQAPPPSPPKGRDSVKMAIKKPDDKPRHSSSPLSPASGEDITREAVAKARENANVQPGPVIPIKADWNMELERVVIPEYAVSGQIHGQPFQPDSVTIEGGILTLRKGKDFLPDQAALVFLFLAKGEKPEGKTYKIVRDQGYGVPHVHIKWRVSGKNSPETEMFMRDYAMRLEFGRIENGKIPGRIYLSLPDKMQSYMAGAFTAQIQ
ncbi:MAG: tetratricopeptide repeat protein [Deltaproteobacteria bacterium]|nr:tetratricopeptide repeat protein [Deltaproteobacteria bacterium]